MTALNTPSHADTVLRNVALSNATLILQWNDMKAQLDGSLLRAACRCAQCRFERHQADIAADAALPVADGRQLALVGVSSMGYGLQLKFSDGHDRGIYPWAYLRELATKP